MVASSQACAPRASYRHLGHDLDGPRGEPPHIYYQLAIVGLRWLGVMLHDVWLSRGAVSPPPPVQPVPPQCKRKRSNEPTPFVGLTRRPHGALCEHDATHPEPQPGCIG